MRVAKNAHAQLVFGKQETAKVTGEVLHSHAHAYEIEVWTNYYQAFFEECLFHGKPRLAGLGLERVQRVVGQEVEIENRRQPDRDSLRLKDRVALEDFSAKDKILIRKELISSAGG